MAYPKGKPTWNKGLTGIYSEETKRKIGLAASKRNKGRKYSAESRKRMSLAHTKKICSACSVKSKWIYKVLIPSVSEYVLLLCDTDFMDQVHSLSPMDKQRVKIIQ